jgi:hypothetical protein
MLGTQLAGAPRFAGGIREMGRNRAIRVWGEIVLEDVSGNYGARERRLYYNRRW